MTSSILPMDEVKLWKMYNAEVGDAMTQEREWLGQNPYTKWFKHTGQYLGLETDDVERTDGWPRACYNL